MDDVVVHRRPVVVAAPDKFRGTAGAAELAAAIGAVPGKVTVVSSQGGTIPGLIERVGRGVRASDTRKGAAWVLSVVDGTIVSTDYYDDAAR